MQDSTSKCSPRHQGNNINGKLFKMVQFSMEYLPIITLILISFSIFLQELSQWKYVCIISSRLEISIKAISWICIAFFQLSRLYYIFGDSVLINDNNNLSTSRNNIKPYSNWLFIFTFMFGIGIIIYFSIIPWIGYSIKYEIQHGNNDKSFINILENGCNSHLKMNEIFTFYTAWSIWFIVGLDWWILSLYFIKLCQFYKISDCSIYNDKIRALYIRISYILKKIVILTILYQISAISMGILRAYTHYNGNQYGLIIVHGSIALERIIVCIVIMLMIEHNDLFYQGLIKRLFCFCQKHNINININNKQNNEENIPRHLVNNINIKNKTKIMDTPTPDDDDDYIDHDENGEIDDSISSSSVPVLSIQSAPKQINIMQIIEINH